MAKHLITGNRGEAIAEKTVLAHGYQIVERNWRHKHLEVDLIAWDGDILVFVEVRTRNDSQFGEPYESIGRDKIQKLARAANIYINHRGHNGEIRFDIVSVILPQNLPPGIYIAPEAHLIKDAFWPE